MKTLIDGYRIYPGEHCGSASMRGLLHHYCGLELPEAAVDVDTPTDLARIAK